MTANGWKIEFFTQDAHGNEKSALLVCSSDDCNPNTNAAAHGLVYVKAPHDDAYLEQTRGGNKDELHFHDKTCDGNPPGDNDDGSCDEPVKIEITIKGDQYHTNGKEYECLRLGGDRCVITIGR